MTETDRPAAPAATEAAAAETAAVLAGIGQRIRALRLARALTLQELAERTALSVSMLSLLERGRTGPSISTLVVVASALGTQMGELLAPPAARGEGPVSRRADQRVFVDGNGVRRRVLKDDDSLGIEVSLIDYAPGPSGADDQMTHEGHEFGVVLAGRIEVMLGSRTYTLNEGDLISYRSDEPHRVVNTEPETARALWLNIRKGQE
ncbi:XRE family transcriptional regulator [Roseomonas sp. NAR14]|uniref:XRE family transcriptional regulator n=1 Tax=Roseomonas acroporae TaxID=2937791 RepID=A0A9X2BT60_9PROT|nr:XRE family transcriptional regulator [Roseomonas acroporae]